MKIDGKKDQQRGRKMNTSFASVQNELASFRSQRATTQEGSDEGLNDHATSDRITMKKLFEEAFRRCLVKDAKLTSGTETGPISVFGAES